MDLELFLYAMALWGVHIFYNTPHRCLSRAKVPVNFCEQSMYLQRYQHELFSLVCCTLMERTPMLQQIFASGFDH